MSLGKTIYQLGYQISPIILTRGVASLVPGGMLPIIALTEAVNFAGGILTGDLNLSQENAFAWFEPIPGAELIKNEVGHYPFANQIIAANAVIRQPLTVSMAMICPIRNTYQTKLPTLTALKYTLDMHIQNGGTFMVVTPSYIYTDCLLVGMADIGGSDSKQSQYVWQLDFEQPLITEESGKNYSDLLGNMETGLPVQGELTWSTVGNTVGSSLSGFAGSLPGMSSLQGALSSIPS